MAHAKWMYNATHAVPLILMKDMRLLETASKMQVGIKNIIKIK